MAIETKVQGGSSTAGQANVDTNYNVQVNLPYGTQGGGITKAGFSTVAFEIDAGDVTGTRYVRAGEVSDDYRLRVGIDQIQFNHSFEGTNIARDRIQQNDTTMTAAQASGFLSINSGNATASGNACNIRTYRTFPLFASYSVYVDMWLREANYNATNAISEWGLGYATSTTAPTDGIFFRRNQSGVLKGVVSLAGTETEVTIDTTNVTPRDNVGTYDPNEVNHFLILEHGDDIEFWINDILVGTIDVPATGGMATSSSSQPLFGRVYNSGVASAARRVEFGFLGVSYGDMHTSKTWGHVIAGMGGGAYQIQPGTASGPTVTRGAGSTGHPTSATARAAGTWTATSAPATNSLGGQWLSPAISTLTSEADYPVFSYQNILGTNAIPGKTLYVTGVRWGKTVATAAASTNSINLNFIVGVGGTSSATTQTEAAAVVASRTIMLDTIPFKATTAIGDYVEGGNMDFFDAPLVVYPGCFLVFIVRPFGTVTSNTLTVVSTVAFSGYFE